jgi:DNA-binding beta-propeller fold protein YncE
MIRGSEGRPLHEHDKISAHNAHESVYGGSPIVPFNSEKSLVINLLTGNIEDQTQRMPFERAPLSQANIDIIKSWIDNGAKNFNGIVPYLNSLKVYVCNQGSDEVFEIDTEYKVVSRIIDVDFISTVIDAPHNVQMRGNYYYVTLIGSGRFLKIDKSTNQVVGQTSGIENAGMIQITKDGTKAFVSRSSTAPSIYNEIYRVDTGTMMIEDTISIPVTGVPHAIWLNNANTKLYIANLTKDRITVVDANTLEIIGDDIILSTSGLDHEPMHIYVSPDDKYLYVNCRKSSVMFVINLETNTVVNGSGLAIQHHPMQSAVSNDGNTIYTVSHHEPVITEITKNGESWTITNEYTNEAFHHLYGADLSPDGRYLYITCANNDPAHQFEPYYKIPGKPMPALVCVYDTQVKEVIKIMDVGSFATGIAAREN